MNIYLNRIDYKDFIRDHEPEAKLIYDKKRI
jgi:hypothetical protein